MTFLGVVAAILRVLVAHVDSPVGDVRGVPTVRACSIVYQVVVAQQGGHAVLPVILCCSLGVVAVTKSEVVTAIIGLNRTLVDSICLLLL